jgi:hypothetical protein
MNDEQIWSRERLLAHTRGGRTVEKIKKTKPVDSAEYRAIQIQWSKRANFLKSA